MLRSKEFFATLNQKIETATYKNKTIDFAKTDGHVIKNYYPKGLRKSIA